MQTLCKTLWNDVALSDVQKLKLNYHRHKGQDQPVWRESTCVAHTRASYDGKAYAYIINVVHFVMWICVDKH